MNADVGSDLWSGCHHSQTQVADECGVLLVRESVPNIAPRLSGRPQDRSTSGAGNQSALGNAAPQISHVEEPKSRPTSLARGFKPSQERSLQLLGQNGRSVSAR